MRVWILIVLVLVLLALGVRESFKNYEEALKDVGQTSGYTSLTPKCPEGSKLNSEKTMCTFTDTTKSDVPPTCSSGTLEFVAGSCKPKTVSQTMSSTKEKEKDKRTVEDQVERSKPTPTSQTPPSGTTTPASKSSTGGSSATSYGPNSGSSKGLDVFGPTFTGIGDGKNLPTTDSSKLNKYPTLLGGGEPRQTTRVEGVGVVTPSKSYQLAMDGSLPSSTSMGSNEENKFFPFSRQPGDMEKIPDPYRVSQQFSASNYSTKTEPVPYLTNFSAFQK